MRLSLVSHCHHVIFPHIANLSTVLRNPAYFFLLFVAAVAAYVTYQLNLWGPIIKMSEAAFHQAVEEGKKWLREHLELGESGRHAIHMAGRGEEYEMSRMNGRQAKVEDEDVDDI